MIAEVVNVKKQNTALLSAAANMLLVIFKFIIGFYSGSISIISEAAHSGVDLLASLIAYGAVKKSGKPPDEQHTYGHGKIENLSAAFEALLIVFAAFAIAYEAIIKFYEKSKPEFLNYGIAIMIVSVGVNIWIARRLYKVAEETQSQALKADALHHAADVWTSVGVLVTLAVIQITGLYWLDPLIAVVVAVVIFKAGFDMTNESLHQLMDVAIPPEEDELIREVLDSFPEVINFHRLRTRHSGSRHMIDMHLTLNRNLQLDEAHAISDRIEAEIESRLGNCDVVIHLEPGDAIEVKKGTALNSQDLSRQT